MDDHKPPRGENTVKAVYDEQLNGYLRSLGLNPAGVLVRFKVQGRPVVVSGLRALDDGSDDPANIEFLLTYDQLKRLAADLLMAAAPEPSRIKSVIRDANGRIIGLAEAAVTSINLAS